MISVPVAEVEPYVARLRARYDPAAQRGLGAHVTLLHSNMHADPIDAGVTEKTAAALSSAASFDYQITRVARFPGTLYLVVEPSAPFVQLHARLAVALAIGARQPEGKEPLVPHVSVVRKSVIDDREIEAELTIMLQRHGPIACVCRTIALLENASGLWRPVQEFVLSDARAGTSKPVYPTPLQDG